MLGRALEAEASHTLAVVGPNELPACPTDHVFTQPSPREVATQLFTALAMLRQWSPYATVTVVFGDHVPAFDMRRARELARANDERVVVIDGELDNLVCVGTVRALWALGRAGAPELLELMDGLVPMIDSDDEDAAIAAIYSLAPYVDFDQILERVAERLVTLGDAPRKRRRATTAREVPLTRAA